MSGTKGMFNIGGVFTAKCVGEDGVEKWSEEFNNRVVTEGLEHTLDVLFLPATAQIDPWYVMLTDGAPLGDLATDTSAQIGGTNAWDEITDYAGTRKAYVESRTALVMSNSTTADFVMDATVTVGGAALVSASAAAGDAAGTLLAVGAFTADRSVVSGDTISVTYTMTIADA